jgi:hypothetical protein
MKTQIIAAVSMLDALAACGQSGENVVAAAGNESNAVAAIENESNAAADDKWAPPPTAEAPPGNNIVPNGVSGSPQQEFSVVNNSGRLVTRLVYSVAGEDDYGIDMLAMQTLPIGYTARVGVGRSEGCVHDLRATFEGGETRDLRGVNVCESSTVTLAAD